MAKQTLQQKMQELRNSDPFADERQFGRLDLSGCPSFFEAELTEQETKPNRFEPADYSGADRHGLRDFLRGLDSDNDAIETAAKMPGASPDLKAEFADRKATKIAVKFKRAAEGRYLS